MAKPRGILLHISPDHEEGEYMGSILAFDSEKAYNFKRCSVNGDELNAGDFVVFEITGERRNRGNHGRQSTREASAVEKDDYAW
eukprot:2382215-Pyramimonas_sp.AAC.1